MAKTPWLFYTYFTDNCQEELANGLFSTYFVYCTKNYQSYMAIAHLLLYEWSKHYDYSTPTVLRIGQHLIAITLLNVYITRNFQQTMAIPRIVSHETYNNLWLIEIIRIVKTVVIFETTYKIIIKTLTKLFIHLFRLA